MNGFADVYGFGLSIDLIILHTTRCWQFKLCFCSVFLLQSQRQKILTINSIEYFSHTSAVNDMTSSGLHIDQLKFQEAKDRYCR